MFNTGQYAGCRSSRTPMPFPATDSRLELLSDWLKSLEGRFALELGSVAVASSDASFRRYFRVATRDSQIPSFIVMDAPPEHEPCQPFIRAATLLSRARVSVPHVLAKDVTRGFLLLTDLGTRTYLSELGRENARDLYGDAVGALLRIQSLRRPAWLPHYDDALLLRELQLFPQWYVQRHIGHTLNAKEQGDLEATFHHLIARNLAEPQVVVHRDYHSRNLMILDDPMEHGNPGILDFQDAVFGPQTYDLVSLLRDAYIDWEEEAVLDWVVRYWELARLHGHEVAADFAEFWQNFEWMGLQRHLKVLGIFARLYHRDGKDGYLKELPRVVGYARAVAGRYRVFTPLLRLFDALEGREAAFGYTF